MRKDTCNGLLGKRSGSFIVIGRAEGRGMVRCECDCGNMMIAGTIDFRKNRISPCIRCGSSPLPEKREKECFRDGWSEKKTKQSKWSNAFNELYSVYKSGAKKRGYSFDIDKETFSILTTAKCHYCGALPSKVKVGYKDSKYTYNGIDRVKNNVGYSKYNVVPCCTRCNKMKLNYSYDEFIEHIHRILNYHRK